MKSVSTKRIGKICLSMAALAAIAGLGVFGISASADDQTSPPAPAASVMPTTAAPDEPSIAEINGQRLSRDQFVQSLIQLNGLDLFNKWERLTVLEQACKQAGIPTGDDIIDAQLKTMYDQMLAHNPNIPEDQRQATFEQAIETQVHEPFIEFRLDLAINTYMLALAKGHVPDVTQDMIQQTYNAYYGPRVEVQDIVVSNLDDAGNVRHLIMDEGQDVTQVVQKYSVDKQSAANGGYRIIPLDSTLTPQWFRDTASVLQPKQLSAAIPDNGVFHLLWLVKKIPASDTPLSDVQDNLKKQLQNAAAIQWGQNELSRLLVQAKVQVDDPALAKLYQPVQEEYNEAEQMLQGAPATTQPSTQP
ncbi:MAG TPA: peptidylprolyl isomerase [Phycisphaerae bacterium]|nr:peptidylprolyl isomerase [Phycisphaerae bacterium]